MQCSDLRQLPAYHTYGRPRNQEPNKHPEEYLKAVRCSRSFAIPSYFLWSPLLSLTFYSHQPPSICHRPQHSPSFSALIPPHLESTVLFYCIHQVSNSALCWRWSISSPGESPLPTVWLLHLCMIGMRSCGMLRSLEPRSSILCLGHLGCCGIQ